MSSPLDTVALIDGVGLLLVLAIGIAGAFKGAARYVVGLITVVVGVSLAVSYGGRLGADSWPVVASTEDPARMGTLVGGGVLFAGTLLAGGLVAKLLRAAIESASLGGIDRFLGFVFGAARGAIFTMVLVLILKALNVESMREDLDHSYALRITKDVASATREYMPESSRDTISRTLELDGAASPAAPR